MELAWPFWRDRRVLVTGHTGFKGAWLCLMLHELGARIAGYALEPDTSPSLFEAANVCKLLTHHTGDIRQRSLLLEIVEHLQPEIVFHLAAQSLVRRSYAEPLLTYETNVLGTLNVLETIRRCPSVRAAVIVTSDKCYRNNGEARPRREADAMGGDDPYSSSKGCAELITDAMRHSYFSNSGCPAVATARAGNVIGGGDWSADRLIPDCVRAATSRKPVRIRNSHAVRPWQHVLDPLWGYLMLAERLTADRPRYARAWNFGPDVADAKPVSAVVTGMMRLWADGAGWICASDPDQPSEADYLSLDASDAQVMLGWHPRLRLDSAIEWTITWYRGFYGGIPAQSLVAEQLQRYGELVEIRQ